jgi:hypothetical protein
VLHSTRNAAQHLQSILVVMMDEIKANIKVWLDDCVLHAKNEADLITTLRTLKFFFDKCAKHGIKLHASKCVLFAREMKYCGRNVSNDGVQNDPKSMAALQDMAEPQNGANVLQYISVVNWMRSAIPRFAELVASLQEVLSKVF